MKYYSIGYCSKNENGLEEVSIEYKRTFLQWLLDKPATVKTFENLNSGDWINKETKNACSTKEINLIKSIIFCLK